VNDARDAMRQEWTNANHPVGCLADAFDRRERVRGHGERDDLRPSDDLTRFDHLAIKQRVHAGSVEIVDRLERLVVYGQQTARTRHERPVSSGRPANLDTRTSDDPSNAIAGGVLVDVAVFQRQQVKLSPRQCQRANRV
jgi:hypothetical protein